MSIHPTAIVADGAVVPASCTIGPYCTVGPNVVLGEECELVSHVVLDGHTTFGSKNKIYSFACLGISPQDLKYAGEPTRVEIGDSNTIREYVTISRGTVGGGGVTRVGSGCLIMAYVHIGHDSVIGNGCLLPNGATLAGHVTVEDYATLSANAPVHQYCTIGRYAYIGGGTTITQDVLPYSLTSIERNNRAYGLNKVGLQRKGFTEEELRELSTAMRLLITGKRNTTQALEEINDMIESGSGGEHVKYLAEFVKKSERGVIKVGVATELIAGGTLGLIAGNGRFPFLLLDAARAHGLRVVVAAIKEETDPEMNERAASEPEHVHVHWLSLGDLSKLIETFQREGVTQAVMAGQVKHKQIFSSIRPDWRLAKLLLNLRTRNTDMLLGAVAKVLEDEGITLMSSTTFLEPMLASDGVLTKRVPDEAELGDIEYGVKVARGIAGFDLGQTVVIAAGACVAVEAMEGTDATIARAGQLFAEMEAEASTLARRLTVVKVAKPNQDMRFDVPVVGVPTVEAMKAAGATCLCVEAGRTLLFDRDAMTRAADAAGIAIIGKAAR